MADNIEPLEIDINEIAVKIEDDVFKHAEIKDPRISNRIDECVSIIFKKETPKDINIDFKKLLNITDDKFNEQFDKIGPVNIERRKVNGNKFFIFLKDFKIILSYMNDEELIQLMHIRTMFQNYHQLNKTQINSITDSVLHTFIPFVNRFINEVDPIAYKPKCKPSDNKALQELYFSETHLKYLVKVIILSKITLVFTDCSKKEYRSEAKKELSKKIWNIIFEEEDKTINMKNKIHKLINSRFISTANNEKRFWSMAVFANITVYSQANAIYNELQTDSILMLEFDKNPLSFLDVFLKYTIYYTTKRKFPLEYVLNNFDSQTNVMNSELSTEVRFNIFENIIMNKSVDTFINRQVKSIIKNDEIYNLFKERFSKNILHFWIVIPLISRIHNISPLFLTTIQKDQFIYLTIYAYYKLISLKCFTMAELLKCEMKEFSTGIYNENVKNTSNVIAKYLKSDELVDFIKSKDVNDNIIDVSKLVINPLITMSMNSYYRMDDGSKYEVNVTDLTQEYLRFLNYYITL